MLTRSESPWPYLGVFLGAGLGGLICWSTISLAGDGDAKPVGTLDPIVVTDKKHWDAVADEKLRMQVVTALHNDPYCYDYHIIVAVKNGVVTLDGFVLDISDVWDAKRISARIPGVKQVIFAAEYFDLD